MSVEEPRLGDPIPMNARAFIANALYEHAKWQPDEINYRLDAYAHELAEKQRDYAEEQWAGGKPALIVRRVVAGRIADLIDPEVLNSGVRPS